MDSPDPTVEIWQQWRLLEEEIFVRSPPFPDETGGCSVEAFITIDWTSGSIVEESCHV
jgi:hypothetical protein